MIPSLAHLSLYKIPYYEIADLSPYQRPPDIYSWNFWREKCRKDFFPGISESLFNSYFDLPLTQIPLRDISGEERYIELWTKMAVTPYSLQVLEPMGALYQALLLNQPDIIFFLFQELDDKQVGILRARVRTSRFLKELSQPTPWQGDIFFFRTAALRELIKHLYHTYHYQEETLNVLGIKEWQIKVESIVQGELPFQEIESFSELEREEALLYFISLGDREAFQLALPNMRRNLAVLASGNLELINLALPSFVPARLPGELPLFLPKLFQQPISTVTFREKEAIFYSNNPLLFYYTINRYSSLFENFFPEKTSYFVKKEPLFSFQICSYSPKYLYSEARDIDIDGTIFNQIGTEEGKRDISPVFIGKALGNLNILKTYLPYLSKEEKKKLLRKLDLYPVSARLVSESLA